MTKPKHPVTLDDIRALQAEVTRCFETYATASDALSWNLHVYASQLENPPPHEHDWQRPDGGGALQCSTCNASYAEEGEEGL